MKEFRQSTERNLFCFEHKVSFQRVECFSRNIHFQSTECFFISAEIFLGRHAYLGKQEDESITFSATIIDLLNGEYSKSKIKKYQLRYQQYKKHIKIFRPSKSLRATVASSETMLPSMIKYNAKVLKATVNTNRN